MINLHYLLRAIIVIIKTKGNLTNLDIYTNIL